MNDQIVLKVARGPKSVYDSFTEQQKSERIYFSMDTNEVYVNDIVFGIDLASVDTNIIADAIKQGNDLIFTKTNGTQIVITLPKASHEEDGLLSKEDKQFIDSIPEVYATKQEVKDYLTWEEISLTLEEVLAKGGMVILSEDIVREQTLKFTNNTYLDLNGKNVTIQQYDANATKAAFYVAEGTLTIHGEGVVDAGTGNLYNVAVWANSPKSKVVINGGTYKNGVDRDGNFSDLIYASEGAVIEIYGGTFEPCIDKNGKGWALNLQDNSGSKILCYGGYFKNFDPANPNTEPDKNHSFVAEGYESVKVEGTDNDYIVQKIN